MKLIDITPFTLEPIKRIADGDRSNVSTIHLSAHAGTHVDAARHGKPGAPAHHILLGGGTIVIEGLNLRDIKPGSYEMFRLPLRVVGADGAPARVVLRSS